MKKIIKKIFSFIPEYLIKKILTLKYGYPNIYHSQFGEDILIKNLFIKKHDGFYVDIGAHHPIKFSNTKILYDKGWSGINIDPIPNMRKEFSERKRDININTGISDTEGKLNYYRFKKEAFNTFDKKVAEEYSNSINKLETIEVPVTTLKEILDKYAPQKNIDFMSIDVEGHEMLVLKSNDWDIYKPSVIAIEDHNLDLEHLEKSEIHSFLNKQGYKIFGHINPTSFYKI